MEQPPKQDQPSSESSSPQELPPSLFSIKIDERILRFKDYWQRHVSKGDDLTTEPYDQQAWDTRLNSAREQQKEILKMIEEHVLSITIQMNRLSMDWKRTREWEDMTGNIQHGFSLIIGKPEEARDKYTQELGDNKKDWEVICHKIMQEERKNYVFLVDTIDKQLSQLQALLFSLAHQVPTKEEKKEAKMHRKEILENYLEMRKIRDSNAIEIWLILWRHTAEAIFDAPR